MLVQTRCEPRWRIPYNLHLSVRPRLLKGSLTLQRMSQVGHYVHINHEPTETRDANQNISINLATCSSSTLNLFPTEYHYSPAGGLEASMETLGKKQAEVMKQKTRMALLVVSDQFSCTHGEIGRFHVSSADSIRLSGEKRQYHRQINSAF